MLGDFIAFTFTSVAQAISSLLSMFEVELVDGVTVNIGTIVLFMFILSYIPKFINLIFGNRKGLVNNGRE